MSRRSARLARMRLCAASDCASLLSIASNALFPFISTLDARALRACCREARAAVADYPFDQAGYWSEADREWVSGPLIYRADAPASVCLARWRACFPRAAGANISGCLDVSREDCARWLKGLKSIDISSCPQVSDAWFPSFAGLQRLIMSDCAQAALTDAAFAHVKGSLRFLVAGNCAQLSDAAFAHFENGKLDTLVLWNNYSLSDRAFEALGGSLSTLIIVRAARCPYCSFAHFVFTALLISPFLLL